VTIRHELEPRDRELLQIFFSCVDTHSDLVRLQEQLGGRFHVLKNLVQRAEAIVTPEKKT
jgi:hypothetical protein